jgi:hypothetical protein
MNEYLDDDYDHNKFCTAVDVVLQQIGDMLKEKNRKYGNSAIRPVRVFSKADPEEQIKVRIDDKISRLVRGGIKDDEDVDQDMVGYLIIKMMMDRELV